jgi:hypothetical protein
MKLFQMLLLSTALIFLFGSANVFADTEVNFLHAHNGTGKTANDVEVFLEGDVLVSEWHSTSDPSVSPLKDFSYSYDSKQDMTTLRWYNGSVPNCTDVDYCGKVKSSSFIQKYLPRWSYDGVPGLVSSPALSTKFELIKFDLVNLTIANTPIDGVPETIGIIQIGPANDVYPLKELTWENLENTKWSVTLNNLPLKVGSSITFSSIPMPSSKNGIVYRAKIWIDNDPNNAIQYAGQFIPSAADLDSVTTVR